MISFRLRSRSFYGASIALCLALAAIITVTRSDRDGTAGTLSMAMGSSPILLCWLAAFLSIPVFRPRVDYAGYLKYSTSLALGGVLAEITQFTTPRSFNILDVMSILIALAIAVISHTAKNKNG